MVAAQALRSRCCRWHAHYHAPSEHAQCVSCDEPMPLVKASLFADVWEHICERCRETLRPKILDLLLAAIRRIARRERRLSEQEPMPQPVRATAPLPQFTNRLRLRDPRGCEAQGGTPHVRT